jgi:mRNA-degrading endonuclease RelE of RelBE toxin-antitoxin system
LRRRVGDWRILYELNESRKLIVVTAVKRRGSNTY